MLFVTHSIQVDWIILAKPTKQVCSIYLVALLESTLSSLTRCESDMRVGVLLTIWIILAQVTL